MHHSLTARGIDHRPGARLGHGRPGSPASRPRCAGGPARDSGRPHGRPLLAGRGPHRHPRRRGGVHRARARPGRGRRRHDYDGAAARPGRRGRVPERRAAARRRPGRPHGRRPGQARPDARPRVRTSTSPAPCRRAGHLDRAGRRGVGAPRLLAPRVRPGAGGRPAHLARGPTSSTTSAPPGSGAVIDFWKTRILDPAMRRLLAKAGGYLFEDSLEIETDATIWTPRMLDGVPSPRRLRPAAVPPGRARGQGEVRLRVRRRHHDAGPRRLQPGALRPLPRPPPAPGRRASRARSAWACACSPTGCETDAVEHAALLDVPERESLGLQEPRRLPGHGRRSRHGGSHGAVLRGGLLRRRGVPDHLGPRAPDARTASTPPASTMA